MRNVFLRRAIKEQKPKPTRRWATTTPRWVQVTIALLLLLALLVIILHLTGNEFGDHMPHSSDLIYGRQPL